MGDATVATMRRPARRQRVEDGVSLRVTDLAEHHRFRPGFRAAGEVCRPAGAGGEAPETIRWEVEVDAPFSGWVRLEHFRFGESDPVASYLVALGSVSA